MALTQINKWLHRPVVHTGLRPTLYRLWWNRTNKQTFVCTLLSLSVFSVLTGSNHIEMWTISTETCCFWQHGSYKSNELIMWCWFDHRSLKHRIKVACCVKYSWAEFQFGKARLISYSWAKWELLTAGLKQIVLWILMLCHFCFRQMFPLSRLLTIKNKPKGFHTAGLHSFALAYQTDKCLMLLISSDYGCWSSLKHK